MPANAPGFGSPVSYHKHQDNPKNQQKSKSIKEKLGILRSATQHNLRHNRSEKQLLIRLQNEKRK